ncbi:Nuclear transport factor 2 [Entomophthora muscae]|uniref:Nuclear transport factor 2 n=1 Tax=Entomophthora muscae TaxID=34485 RepID=A0ACC2SXZ7_9FUNG|nr:Nuclear transport factor 2 [Entomophthora muscae]
MSSSNLKELVSYSALGAQKFVTHYYNIMDTKRTNLPQLYRENSKIPRHNLSGFTGLNEVIGLPATKYSVRCFNSHPLPSIASAIDFTNLNSVSPSVQGSCCILVNVSGDVVYGADRRGRAFSQTFILAPDVEKSNTFYVSNDCFRFV